MNDLSGLRLLEFFAESSDYGKCLDISSKGIGRLEENGPESSVRNFLARIEKKRIPSLIIVLQKAIQS